MTGTSRFAAVISTMVLFSSVAHCQSARAGHPVSAKREPATKRYQQQIDELQKQVTALANKVSESESTVSNLQAALIGLEIRQNAHQSVSLDTSSRDYQRIDTSTGSFLISVKDVSTYLDGYRITLDIGNPSFVTYAGLKLTVNWNTKYDWSKYAAASYAAWQKATRQKEISFTDSLVPGRWNQVDLLLPSTTSDELGYLEVSMETNTLSLAGGQ